MCSCRYCLDLKVYDYVDCTRCPEIVEAMSTLSIRAQWAVRKYGIGELKESEDIDNLRNVGKVASKEVEAFLEVIN